MTDTENSQLVDRKAILGSVVRDNDLSNISVAFTPNSLYLLSSMSGFIDSTVVPSVLDADKKISRHSRVQFTRRRVLKDGRM